MTRVMALGEVGSYFNGKAFKPSDWSGEGLPIIRIANLNDASAPFNYFLGDVRAEQRVGDGDLLVSWSASLDAYIWRGGPAVVNQHIFKVYERPAVVDRTYLWYALRSVMRGIRAQVHGATMQHITKPEFEAISIPVPPMKAQRRIAASLNEQLAEVASARESAIDRSRLSRRLGLSVLAQAVLRSGDWPRHRIGEITDSPRSPSVASHGETAVTTVTSGCLTPFGFSFDGLGVGRMSSRDALDGVVAVDEVLVSRSNTQELVGRASRYPGGSSSVVASDLVFRLVPDPSSLTADYLADYLSVLQLEGYWRDRSSGASSTMKKIRKTLLLNVEIPLPPLQEQARLTAELRERLATINALETTIRAEREAIDGLPAALLRRAFEDRAA